MFSLVLTVAFFCLMTAAVIPGVTGATAVDLGTARTFAVLAESAITDTTSSSSVISGDVGLSPTTGAAIVGFDTCTQVSGAGKTIYKVAAAGPVCALNDPATVGKAVTDMESAYSSANSGAPDFPVTPGEIGGRTLLPGNYSWTEAVSIASGDVTLDGQGDANAVWILRTTGTLTSGADRKVILINGAQPGNIFWVVAGYTELGANSGFNGTILGAGYITLDTGAKLTGRALAHTAVTLNKNTVTVPLPRGAPTAAFTFTNATGMAPLTVAFTDTSSADPTATITTWAWDFDNDGIIDDTTRNPVHIYNTTGTYTPNLTVTDSFGAIATKLETITVFPAPVADFTFTPANGPAYLKVAFTDTSTSAGTIASWAWDFDNDGIIDNTTRNPVHTYNTEGVYTVNLTIKDSYGAVATKLDTVHVTSPSLEITVTNVPISLALHPGVINTNAEARFYVNSSSDWEVTAQDSDSHNTNGFMTSYSGIQYDPATRLNHPFLVMDQVSDYVPISTNPILQKGNPEVSGTAYPLGVQQEVTLTDPVLTGSNVYRIVVTLTIASL